MIERLFSQGGWLAGLVDEMAPHIDRLEKLGRSISYPLDFSQADLQAKVEDAFPYTGHFFLLEGTAFDPQLSLLADGWAELRVRLEVKMAGFSIPGHGMLRSRLHYNKEEGAFFLQDLSVEQLVLAGTVRPWWLLRLEIGRRLARWADQEPLHKLDSESPRDQWWRCVIEGVEVREGVLRFTLAPQWDRFAPNAQAKT